MKRVHPKPELNKKYRYTLVEKEMSIKLWTVAVVLAIFQLMLIMYVILG